MNKTHIVLAGALTLASPAAAQTAMTIDPVTGNYVPAKDPFMAGAPDPGNNPNRLSNSVSRRQGAILSPKTGSAGGVAADKTGKTAAQQAAGDADRNGAGDASQRVKSGQVKAGAGSVRASSQNTGDAFASVPGYDPDNAVALGDMTVYQAPGSAMAKSPFALPDWWPSGQDAGVSVQLPNP